MGRTRRYYSSLLLVAFWVAAATAHTKGYYKKMQDRHNEKLNNLKHRFDEDPNAKEEQKPQHKPHHHHDHGDNSTHHHHHHDDHDSDRSQQQTKKGTTTKEEPPEEVDTKEESDPNVPEKEDNIPQKEEQPQNTTTTTSEPNVFEVPHTSEKNVFEKELHPCSTKGMALTGLLYGRCVATRNHICIDLPSFPTFFKGKRLAPGDHTHDNEGGSGWRISLYSLVFGSPRVENFFTLTGQPNLLEQDQDQHPCTEDPAKTDCPIRHWCVDEQSFASFLAQAGGCRQIGRILCEATNLQALETFEQDLIDGGQGADESMQAALKCLRDQCWLS